MASGSWLARNKQLPVQDLVSFSGVVTNKQISATETVTPEGALHMVIDVRLTGVTVAGAITITHQDSYDNFVNSINTKKTATVSGNGIVTIKYLAEAAADQTYLPLRQQHRLVITSTNAGDAATIAEVMVSQDR